MWPRSPASIKAVLVRFPVLVDICCIQVFGFGVGLFQSGIVSRLATISPRSTGGSAKHREARDSRVELGFDCMLLRPNARLDCILGKVNCVLQTLTDSH